MKRPARKKTCRRKHPEKPHTQPREAERSVKNKSPSDYIDAKMKDLKEHDTFARDVLVCPFCGHEHEPSDLKVEKKSGGTVKCGDCGEAFEFEMTEKIAYSTYEPG